MNNMIRTIYLFEDKLAFIDKNSSWPNPKYINPRNRTKKLLVNLVMEHTTLLVPFF